MMAKQPKGTFEQIELHNIPPWPEWSDSAINSVQWNRSVKHSMVVVPSTPNVRGKPLYESEDFFEDPAGTLEMPSDIIVHLWKRPHQIEPDMNYVIVADPTPLDLVTNNKHLLDYEIMRIIISSVTCLERESFYRPFPIEFQSDQLIVSETQWKPWHHVYALTQAGKGQVHNPQYNIHGKYIVRLFFLGKWRRILVDDRLPIDSQGQIMLPMSRPDNLWLPLLSKALMKVASLSWVGPSHCVDFSVIHCLTGWLPTKVPCKGCSMYQMWCVCCQMMATTEEVVKGPGCCNNDTQRPSLPEVTDKYAVGSRAILAFVTPKEPGMLEEVVLIGGARYDNEQLTPVWKQYRWNEWAYNKGIIPEIPHKAVRNILIYNPFIVSSKTSQATNAAVGEVWIDFEHFAPFVRTLEVYYKPSYFKYSLRAWSEQELLQNPQVAEDVILKPHKLTLTKGKGEDGKSTKTSGKPGTDTTSKPGKGKGKGKVSEDSGKIKEDAPKDLRKPSFFYLKLDSMTPKTVLCSMSVYSPDRASYAIIFIGRFKWHSPSVANITNRISTTATSAQYFVLPPGLRVFRVWHQFPTYFCLQVYSNTLFQSGSKMSIQQNLTSDSISYKFYGKEISSSLEQVLAAPQGGAAHGGAYQQLIRSLEPLDLPRQLPWPQWFTVHTELTNVFEESLTEMLVESVHHVEEIYQTVQAFQLLFLNPVFGMKTLKSIRPDVYEYIMRQKESNRQKMLLLEQEMKERFVQMSEEKGKKGSKSKKSLESPKTEVISKPTKSERKGNKKDKDKVKPMTEGEQLKKLLPCKEKTLMIGDQSQAILLLKRMMAKIPHIRCLYPFSQEDDIKLVLRDYVGELHNKDGWVVLVRCILNIHSLEPVPCSLHIWSPVENLVLRMIDNDSNDEVLPLGFVENNMATLSRNKGGYTICAYGLADHNTRPVMWRLRSMGLREADCLHICKENMADCVNNCTSLPEQHQETVFGYYVPNKQNVIANCLLEVLTDMTVMLRLHLSNSYVVCRLTVTDEAGEVVTNLTGIGHVLITSLSLKGREKMVRFSSAAKASDQERMVEPRTKMLPTVYRVKATLEDKSWPLHTLQIQAMSYYKEHLPAILDKPIDRRPLEKLSLVSATPRPRERRRSTLRSETKVERVSIIMESHNPDEILFENLSDKPTWSLTLVTDLQEEITPVKIKLDMSLYEQLNALKKEWGENGFVMEDGISLRKDFLQEYQDELDKEPSEEVVFKLKAKKLEKLNEQFGERMSGDILRKLYPSTVGDKTSVHSLRQTENTDKGIQHTEFESCFSVSEMQRTISESCRTVSDFQGTLSDTHYTVKSGSEKTPKHLSMASTPHKSISLVSERMSQKVGELEKLQESCPKVDYSIMLQQAEIHKALLKMRERTLDHNGQVFKETADLREKIINEMKMAKEVEAGNNKSKPDTKAKKSKDVSPGGTKGKSSLKGVKRNGK